jgi:hypothetical protein
VRVADVAGAEDADVHRVRSCISTMLKYKVRPLGGGAQREGPFRGLPSVVRWRRHRR